WSFQGGLPATSTDANPSTICYNTPGNYDVQLIVSNATTSDTLFLPNYITVYPTPLPQGIIQSGDTLFANSGSAGYQWFFNGNMINGGTNYFYVALTSGDYNVVATDANGCEVEAAVFDVVASSQSSIYNFQFTISPNPVVDKFTIHSRWLSGSQFTIGAAIDISIYNIVGEKVFSAVDCRLRTVDCRLFPSGIYFIKATSSTGIAVAKFIKE
ncbi:MAG: T9SS type A sorting domain-containing protein, partial [Bacteroidota bacterium]